MPFSDDEKKTDPDDEGIVPKGARRTGQSWLISILPFIEELTLYDQLDLTTEFQKWSGSGILTPSNLQFIEVAPEAFRCPSGFDPEVATSVATDSTANNAIFWVYNVNRTASGTANYLGCLGNNAISDGSVHFEEGTSAEPCENARIECPGFNWRLDEFWQVRIGTVIDGTSKTFLYGEQLPRWNRHSSLVPIPTTPAAQRIPH